MQAKIEESQDRVWSQDVEAVVAEDDCGQATRHA
jgi:hypothetical protein